MVNKAQAQPKRGLASASFWPAQPMNTLQLTLSIYKCNDLAPVWLVVENYIKPAPQEDMVRRSRMADGEEAQKKTKEAAFSSGLMHVIPFVDFSTNQFWPN